MTNFGKLSLVIYVLLLGLTLPLACVKQKKPDVTPRVYDFPDLNDEEIEDLPEDTAEIQYPPADEY